LFAYGHKYLSGKGETLLIYPKTNTCSAIEHSFDFTFDLKLWVCSFDLEADTMSWPDHWQEKLFTALSQNG
jgi:5-methylcytosine-specific restriction enzyme subunit McrC